MTTTSPVRRHFGDGAVAACTHSEVHPPATATASQGTSPRHASTHPTPSQRPESFTTTQAPLPKRISVGISRRAGAATTGDPGQNAHASAGRQLQPNSIADAAASQPRSQAPASWSGVSSHVNPSTKGPDRCQIHVIKCRMRAVARPARARRVSRSHRFSAPPRGRRTHVATSAPLASTNSGIHAPARR